jgi:hypothetical protein
VSSVASGGLAFSPLTGAMTIETVECRGETGVHSPAGKPVSRSGNARRIGRRSVTGLRKKMRRNVAERDARVLPEKRNAKVSSSRTQSVFVGNDAKVLFTGEG